MSRVRYTDFEWDQLFELCWQLRLLDPVSSLTTLASQAMKQMKRKRSVTGLRPVEERFKLRFKEIDRLKRENQALQQRVQTLEATVKAAEHLLNDPDPQYIREHIELFVDTLTPQEIIERLTPEAMMAAMSTPDVFAVAARRYGEALVREAVIREISTGKRPSKLSKSPTRQNLPRVVIVGGPRDRNIFEPLDPLANWSQHTEANRDLPLKADLYIIITGLCSHKLYKKAKAVAPAGKLVHCNETGNATIIEAIQLQLEERCLI